MVSSLAAQLAHSASLNSSLLVDRSRRKGTESYLFSAKEAQQHDLDAIYALGVNGFMQLKSIEPSFESYYKALFSDSAKVTDRTLLPVDANVALEQQLASFLPLLGPYLMDAPAGRILEWLVRRFRINEFNVQDILTLFMPYHESPHFAKMVTILHIDGQSTFRFLNAYKTTAKPVPRGALVTEMLRNTDLARFVSALLPRALRHGGASAHKALIIFHTGVLLDFVARNSDVDEGTTAFLLPAATDPLQLELDIISRVRSSIFQESVLGSYLILAAISQKCHLTPKALKAVLKTVAACAEHVSQKQFVRTLLCICAPQVELDKLPRSLAGTLTRLSNSHLEIEEGLAWVGSEKLVGPLVDGLIDQLAKDRALALLQSILTYSEVPETIIHRAASSILSKLIETYDMSDESIINCRKVFSDLQQRFPGVVEAVTDHALQEREGDRKTIEEVINNLSLPVAGSSKSRQKQELDSIVASLSADSHMRVIAVQELYSALSHNKILESDMDSVKSAMLMRVQDSESSVISVLYSQPTHLLPILLSSADTYITSLSHILHSTGSSPSRQLVQLHLSFLAHQFFEPLREKNLMLSERIVHELFFPYLLFSKPRQRTASVVWELLVESEKAGETISRHELLGGCVDAVRWEQSQQQETEVQQDEGGTRNAELLAKINLAIAARMADNVITSNSYDSLFEGLLIKLQDANAHSRALAFLVVRALFSRLSGDHQIDAAHRILRAMKIQSLEGMGEFMRGVDNLAVFLHDMSVGMAVVLKPSSRHTVHKLQVAVLAMMPAISRPSGVTLDWIQTSHSDPIAASDHETRGVRYVQLMRAVYQLSNSSASLPLLSIHLLRALFLNLSADALVFLAGVWLGFKAEQNNQGKSHVCAAALRHATAFLEADLATDNRLDYQTILPAILVAVQSAERHVRDAALECISTMVKMAHIYDSVSGVYAFDAIYSKSKTLQYIEWADLRKYIVALGESRSHLLHDPAYIEAFHRDHLTMSKSDGKKQAGYKQRVLCYVLSHVHTCQLYSVKLSLLRCLETTANEVKSQTLLPTIEALLATATTDEAGKPNFESRELLALAVNSFDATASGFLNDSSNTAWSTYEKSLRLCYRNTAMRAPQEILSYQLQHGLFSRLSVERKVALCRILLEVGTNEMNIMECKLLLKGILTEVPVIMHLLLSLRPVSLDAAERAVKRPRLDDATHSKGHETSTLLSLLAEVLSSIKLPGSLDLIACLLETLSRVVHDTSAAPGDKNYTEQLLMSSVDSAVTSVPDASNIPAGMIRVDILVELIRTAENPQTFHQALLLMAGIARLAPDAVLHNIMPVFTFMGSNVFHRDDTYSFRVVQKTIENIVPVMVRSLKRMYTSQFDLYVGAREFLRIFSDASNHIPRHRRAKFFSHLVNVLGPDDFLAPICMLLVDKISNRVVRQPSAEAQASFMLPLTISRQYSVEQRLMVLIQALHELERLLKKAEVGNDADPTFLTAISDDEHTSRPQLMCRRQALSLLLFCHHALREYPANSVFQGGRERVSSSELLSLLLGVAVANDVHGNRIEIASAARLAMESALRIMSATDFVNGVLVIINSGDAKVQSGALQLLGERLASVTEEVRRNLTSTVVEIINIIRTLLTTRAEESLLHAALSATKSISQSACVGEENALTTLVPLILDAMQSPTIVSDALIVLLSLCSKLGPRIIPHMKGIVQKCVNIIRGYITLEQKASGPTTEAIEVVQSLLISNSTFWGNHELTEVIHLHLQSCVAASKAEASILTPVMRTMAKRVPSKLLFSTLSAVWSKLTLDTESENTLHYAGYFSLMKRSVRAASRPDVLEHLRSLFKIFQDALDICTLDGKHDIEHELIPAFLELVVKLNETAFRPLFRKLSDWAFVDESGLAHARITTFCHMYNSLLDYFKALMVPYLSFTWQSFLRVLSNYSSAQTQETPVWISVLETLTKGLAFDEGGFWRGDKLQQLVPLVVQQVPVAIRLQVSEGKNALIDCLVATMEIVNDDALLKSMNLAILMHSRSEDAKTRLYSLACSETLWRAHGGKLLGFVAETTTFIAECAEDENDSVVREVHKLKDTVESIVGKIDV